MRATDEVMEAVRADLQETVDMIREGLQNDNMYECDFYSNRLRHDRDYVCRVLNLVVDVKAFTVSVTRIEVET